MGINFDLRRASVFSILSARLDKGLSSLRCDFGTLILLLQLSLQLYGTRRLRCSPSKSVLLLNDVFQSLKILYYSFCYSRCY